MLQQFRACYLAYQHSGGSRGIVNMFELRKLYYDENHNMHKVTSFALSGTELPEFIDIANIINYDVTLLSNERINNYVSQCKSYGIL